jgi:hypothetical protein
MSRGIDRLIMFGGFSPVAISTTVTEVLSAGPSRICACAV